MKKDYENAMREELEALKREHAHLLQHVRPETLEIIQPAPAEKIIRTATRKFYAKWGGIFLIVLLAVAGLAFGVATFLQGDFRELVHDTAEDDPDFVADTAKENFNLYGNSDGNLANGGAVAVQADWVYVADAGGIYKQQGANADKIQISDIAARQMNILGNWLYFYAPEEKAVCKIRTDGQDLQYLAEDVQIQKLVGYKNFLYYSDAEGSVYRILTSGEKKYRLLQDLPIQNFSIYQDNICFSYQNDGKTAIAIKNLSYGDVQRLSADAGSENAYFAAEAVFLLEDGEITKIPLQQSEKIPVAACSSGLFTVFENRIVSDDMVLDHDGNILQTLPQKYDALFEIQTGLVGKTGDQFELVEEPA